MRRALIAGFVVLSVVAALDLFGPGPGISGLIGERPFVEVDLFGGDAFPPDYESAPASEALTVAPGERIAVDGTVGVLTVREAPSSEAAVTYTVQVWGRGDLEAVARSVKVLWQREAEGARLVVERPQELPRGVRGFRIDADLSVPQGAGVEILHRGDVTAEGLSGALQLNYSAGRAHVKAVRGPVSVKGQLGSLLVRDAAGPVEVEHSGGQVTVQNAAGPVSGALQLGEATIGSVAGDVSFKVSRGAGRFEQIGGDLELEGNIVSFDITGVRGFVDLDLSMGDATVDGLIGGADLNVGLGEVTVRLAPGGGWKVDAVAEMGELRSTYNLNRVEVGPRTVWSGTIGDGRHPLAIEVRQGSVELR